MVLSKQFNWKKDKPNSYLLSKAIDEFTYKGD